MRRAVFDTTVLVSAFPNPVKGSPSYDLLTLVNMGTVELILSDDILEETINVLLTTARLRKRYHYTDADAVDYCRALASLATEVLSKVPQIRIVRDPNDDMILACAIAAKADLLITRDKDLLSLKTHNKILISTPEQVLPTLRNAED